MNPKYSIAKIAHCFSSWIISPSAALTSMRPRCSAVCCACESSGVAFKQYSGSRPSSALSSALNASRRASANAVVACSPSLPKRQLARNGFERSPQSCSRSASAVSTSHAPAALTRIHRSYPSRRISAKQPEIASALDSVGDSVGD